MNNKELNGLSTSKRIKYNLLITHAMALFEQGKLPSVSELAEVSGVSRATAYRYFPTQSSLIAAVVDEVLRPVIDWEPAAEETGQRVEELLNHAFPTMLAHEGALRAALLISLQQWASERATDSGNHAKTRQSHRQKILALVTAPLKKDIDDALWERVNHALSVIYGSEILLVLKDIWGLDNEQVMSTTRWMAKAILSQAQADMANHR
ncbi:TetR/AcrR family transcriptional regulator [Entomohabitans teleogrylli]|uniref:TetR/AcrR family transcriptional regulator n=1 Tax=Entomohabitans teleogrylli TaxID=1384589 RepID=UPI000AA0819B|nr:TetR/AcrR family transcriptional regulator [Entomohabitans teleogrylli]